MSIGEGLEAKRNRRERERVDARTGHMMTTAKPATAAPAGSIPDGSGTAPLIDSEAGTAGTAATWLKSDTKPGLPLGTEDTGGGGAYKSLAFAGGGLRVKMIKPLSIASTGVGLNTGVGLTIGGAVGGEGVRANCVYVDVASDPGLEFALDGAGGTEHGLRAKVKDNAGLVRDADGLSVKVKANAGLVCNADGLAANPDGATITVNGSGQLVASAATPAAHKTSHEDSGTDEISIAGLSGEAADVQKPKIDGLTAETSVADADTFPFYDATAAANRKVTAANLKTYIGGGGISVDGDVLGSSGSTSSNPIMSETLGADGNYLVFFQAKVSGGTGEFSGYLRYTVGMDTYTVAEVHSYCSDSTNGQTLFGMTMLASWDNDNALELHVESGSAKTVEASETFMYWVKY